MTYVVSSYYRRGVPGHAYGALKDQSRFASHAEALTQAETYKADDEACLILLYDDVTRHSQYFKLSLNMSVGKAPKEPYVPRDDM